MRKFVRNLQAPPLPWMCELVGIETAVVPFALGALEERAAPFVWQDGDALIGVQMIRRLQVALLSGCLDELIASQERIFQVLDNGINGTRYDDFQSGTSMRVELVRIRELLEAQQSQESLDPEILAQLIQIAALL